MLRMNFTFIAVHPTFLPYYKGFKLSFLAQVSNAKGEPRNRRKGRKGRKGRKQAPSADDSGCGIGDPGSEVFVGFARFAVPRFQP